jgi:hypothetical protein
MVGSKRARPQDADDRSAEPSGSDSDSGSGSGPEEDHAGTSGSSDGEEEQALQAQLADIPFEVLEQLRAEGRGMSGAEAAARATREKGRSFHRENKNRPSEMSSKRPVPRLREVVDVPKTWVARAAHHAPPPRHTSLPPWPSTAAAGLQQRGRWAGGVGRIGAHAGRAPGLRQLRAAAACAPHPTPPSLPPSLQAACRPPVRGPETRRPQGGSVARCEAALQVLPAPRLACAVASGAPSCCLAPSNAGGAPATTPRPRMQVAVR